jgi:uncharacterized protein YcbK (DUF882 family)
VAICHHNATVLTDSDGTKQRLTNLVDIRADRARTTFGDQNQQPTRRRALKTFIGTGNPGTNGATRFMMAMMIAFALAAGFTLAGTAKADAQTRSLKIHYIHTKESAEITYMRNGRYVQSGLDQLNHFLRDWRRNEPTKMDPRLFDILWEIYRQTGATDHIHVVSAYRSPATNAMLRSRSSGVAENSQHTLGKAIDFYIPGVQLSRLRAAALRIHGGGVGFYPRSGAPFIHVDVGSVRHWPRMNRNDLMAVFPDGKTIHVPSDGRALPGFQQAKAEYDARQRGGGSIQVADDRSSGSGGCGGGLLAALFGNNRANNAAPAGEATQPARATATAQAPRPQQAVTPQPQAPVGACRSGAARRSASFRRRG